jgi:hypothetical protein
VETFLFFERNAKTGLLKKTGLKQVEGPGCVQMGNMNNKSMIILKWCVDPANSGTTASRHGWYLPTAN